MTIIADDDYDTSALEAVEICNEGFEFMFDEMWYTDLLILQDDFDTYNYTP